MMLSGNIIDIGRFPFPDTGRTLQKVTKNAWKQCIV